MNPNDKKEALNDNEKQTYDMSQEAPIKHRFEKIIGNELHCILHSTCTVIRIKPTEVLEKDADGNLQLVDKAVAA